MTIWVNSFVKVYRQTKLIAIKFVRYKISFDKLYKISSFSGIIIFNGNADLNV